MTEYQFAQGHDNTAGLADIDPQPRNPVDVFWERLRPNGVAVNIGGGQARFEYRGLTYAQFESLMTTFGLSRDTPAAKGTFRLRDYNGTDYANYNGTIEYQPLERGVRYWRDVNFDIYRLVAL
jgi:hypothetical protein